MIIFYSIQNCGDGSAYPMFFNSEELAQWDQDHMEDGWGESCTGQLEIHGDDTCYCDEVHDAVQYWLVRTEDEHYEPWDLRAEFLAKFFPDGLPKFEVVRVEDDNTHYHVYVCGVKMANVFGYNLETQKVETTEVGRAMLEVRLNNS